MKPIKPIKWSSDVRDGATSAVLNTDTIAHSNRLAEKNKNDDNRSMTQKILRLEIQVVRLSLKLEALSKQLSNKSKD